MMKKYRIALVGLLAGGMSLASVGLASAESASNTSRTNSTNVPCTDGDSITSGLWAGVNLSLDTRYDCHGNVADTDSSEEVNLKDNEDNSEANGKDATSPDEPAEEPGSESGNGYVALGDSIAAGLGLLPAGDTDAACGVSTEAYPALVAEELGVPYQNHACSGATAGDLSTEQHLSGTSRDIEPQLDTAFAGGVPSLVTVTAGANDTYWPYFIRKCYVATCGTGTDRATATALLSALRLKLGYALSDIGARSDGAPPQVILTGYYNPLSTACVNQQDEVTATELSWLDRQTDALNRVIADAADNHPSFVSFAPVSFDGHELCSDDPWVQRLEDQAPFHPTTEGQQAIAEAVLRQVD